PLVTDGHGDDTAEISRDHSLLVSSSGLITIAGGKWTTYRKMAEDTVDQAAKIGGLDQKDCRTDVLRIHGWDLNVDKNDWMGYYGSDRAAIKALIEERPELGAPLHEKLPYIKAEVVWAVQNEMAINVADFISRRSRALLLDVAASIEIAPEVARLMASEE